MDALSRWSTRRKLLAGFISGSASFAAAVAWGIDGAGSFGRPHVSVLGSGNSLSLLVVDGPARLLLAAGDDPAAFGNALTKSRPFGRDRIDILLLAGTANDLTFLARAKGAANARHVEVVGKPEIVGRLELPPSSHMPTPRRFRLSAWTDVIVETLERADTDTGPSFAWRAMVESGATRLLALSDGRVAAEFPDAGKVSAVVVSGDAIAELIGVVDTRAVIASAEAISGKALRGELADMQRGPQWMLRVHAGDARRFDLTDRGLRLPVDVEPVAPTAEPAAQTPSPR